MFNLFNSSSSATLERGRRGVHAQMQHFPVGRIADDGPGAQEWKFPAHLDNPNCPWLQALKHVYAQKITFPASLSPEAGQLLHAITLNTRPRTVVETGMFLGISTIWIAAAMELAGSEGVLHSIDDFRPIHRGRWRGEEMLEGREDRVREHIQMAGLAHRVIIHRGNSVEGVGDVAAMVGAQHPEGGGVQMAFLDADHSPEGVRREFQALEPVLDTGGYVILHDIFPELCRWRGPRALMDTVNSLGLGSYECLDLYLAPTNFGLGVLRRVG